MTMISFLVTGLLGRARRAERLGVVLLGCLQVVVIAGLVVQGFDVTLGERIRPLTLAFAAGALPMVAGGARALTTEYRGEWILLTCPVAPGRYFLVKAGLWALLGVSLTLVTVATLGASFPGIATGDVLVALLALPLLGLNSVGVAVAVSPRIGSRTNAVEPGMVAVQGLLLFGHMLAVVERSLAFPVLVLSATSAAVLFAEIRRNSGLLLDVLPPASPPLVALGMGMTFFFVRTVAAFIASLGLGAGMSHALGNLAGLGALILVERILGGIRQIRWPTGNMRQFTILTAAGFVTGVGLASLPRVLASLSSSWTPPSSTVNANTLFAVVVAAVAEEAVFRHALQRRFAQSWGAFPAIALTAAVFTSLHPTAPVGPLALAVVSGVLYARSGTLGPCFALHAAYNVALLVP